MNNDFKRTGRIKGLLFAFTGIALVAILAGLLAWKMLSSSTTTTTPPANTPSRENPLSGVRFFNDRDREVVKWATRLRESGETENATLADRIADQPGTTWLLGPTTNDPNGSTDIAEVRRTSTEAVAQGTTPIYQLYAIPNRDACAPFSKNRFISRAEYLVWLDSILEALQGTAIFSVEPDAVAHTLQNGCMNEAAITERYDILRVTSKRLANSPKVLAHYIDAGHSEWFPDETVLIEPLQKAGIEYATGIAVNVSNFVDTTTITNWAQELATALGGQKGVIIDTSRNGQGSPPLGWGNDGTRWCNPAGRGIGVPPRVTTIPYIDAYFYGKNIGESDGACFGYPEAGVFIPEKALEMARAASIP